MAVDLAVAQQREQPLDFVVGDGAPQADAVDVVDRHEHRRLVRHPELIEPAGRAHDGLGLDAFDHTEPMIRVDDLVADLKCHVSPDVLVAES